jgi:hypothetical protein
MSAHVCLTPVIEIAADLIRVLPCAGKADEMTQ